jgi:hypothetical protein
VRERADYPASYEAVSDMLRKLWDLKIVQDVKVGPSQFARLELVEPGKGAGAGTRIAFLDKDDKQLAALLLGKRFMKKGDSGFGGMGEFPAGRYVLPLGGEQKVSLVSDALEDVNVKPEGWLKRDFFKIENPKTITLAGVAEPQHWKLVRDNATAEWKLDGAKPDEAVDPAKASSIAMGFANPSFTDVLAPDAKPEDTGLDKPAVLGFETFDNFTYTLKIGKVTGENYPVTIAVTADFPRQRMPGKDEKPEDKTKLDDAFSANLKKLDEKLAAEKKLEGRPYLIGKFTIDQVVKDRASLLVEKKPETPPAAGAPVPPGTPAIGAPRREPISVTTPPVSVPPLPAPEPQAPKDDTAPKKEDAPPAKEPAPAPAKP